MQVLEDVKLVLKDTLKLGDRVDRFDAATPLFGTVPEFDSMAVVAVVTAIEERFDVLIEDDEISAEVFETVGSLRDFIETKLAA